jgi:hypothetical protein
MAGLGFPIRALLLRILPCCPKKMSPSGDVGISPGLEGHEGETARAHDAQMLGGSSHLSE